MGFLQLLVSRYSYVKVAARFNVSTTYLRAITAGERAASGRILNLSRNLYRTTMYNRLKSFGVPASSARAWRGRDIDFIDGMVSRYKTISKTIAEQRNTTQAAIRRSLTETDMNIEELEESYTSLK